MTNLLSSVAGEPGIDEKLDMLAARCQHLSTLKAGWLNGDGAAVDPRCTDRAYRWLAPLVEDGTFIRAPRVYPRPDGSVQAEFHGGPFVGELVFGLDGSVVVEIDDLVSGATVEAVLHPHDAWSASASIKAFLSANRVDLGSGHNPARATS